MGTPPAQGAPRKLTSEAGVTMIETLISAVILVIVIGAVLTTIDASGRTTTVNKNRSVAATLAEQDQERLRAMSPTKLATFSEPAASTDIGGVTYTVQSESEWIIDASGATQSCENATGQANYLRISSTVTSSVVGTRVKPVVMRSIVSPRVESFPENTGTLTVKVTDQLGQPVQNLPVTITPAATVPRTTNQFGCAVFSHIPTGAYTATLDSLGWVNEQREQEYDMSANVQLEKTTNIGMTYAQAASVRATIKTGTAPGTVASKAHAVTVSNAKSGDIASLAAPTNPDGTVVVGPLFPYPDGYTAYAGRCTLNDPTDPGYQPANAAYVATNPGFTDVTPGLMSDVDAFQPSVNLKVQDSGGAVVSGARVVFTQDTGTAPAVCGSTSNSARFVRTTGADGFLTDRGMPFGKYTVCVDKVIGTSRYRREPIAVNNTSPAGVTPSTVSLPSTSTTVACST